MGAKSSQSNAYWWGFAGLLTVAWVVGLGFYFTDENIEPYIGTWSGLGKNGVVTIRFQRNGVFSSVTSDPPVKNQDCYFAGSALRKKVSIGCQDNNGNESVRLYDAKLSSDESELTLRCLDVETEIDATFRRYSD